MPGRPNESRACSVLRSNTQMRAGLLLATYKKRCPGSGEKATLAAVLLLLHPPPTTRHQRSIHTCVMYLPSVVKTCTRLPPRSATYTSPSFETLTPCTGGTNCEGPGSLGSNSVARVRVDSSSATAAFAASPVNAGGRGGSSIGVLPNAPHMRLYAPVSASNTITRLLPYPSATKISLVLGYTKTSAGFQRLVV